MSLKLYFVRHGQSEANLRDDYYNDSEAELTALGRAQANEVGLRLKELGIDFTAVYCSTYRRARSTCAIALKAASIDDCQVIYDDGLIERRFDGLIGVVCSYDCNRELCDYNSDLAAILDVETLECLEDRARRFVEKLKAEYDEGNILVFSHGFFGLVVQIVVEGRLPSGNLFDLPMLNNCEYKVFELK